MRNILLKYAYTIICNNIHTYYILESSTEAYKAHKAAELAPSISLATTVQFMFSF
jgi:hypothetical protein